MNNAFWTLFSLVCAVLACMMAIDAKSEPMWILFAATAAIHIGIVIVRVVLGWREL